MTKLSRLAKILVWVVIGAVAAIVAGWWFARLLREEEDSEEALWTPPQPPAEFTIPLPSQLLEDEASPLEPPAVGESAGPADFTRILGIGPKYAQALTTLGISTFAALSQQEPEALAEQLRAQGLRVIGDRIEQDDWIGQAARLASEG